MSISNFHQGLKSPISSTFLSLKLALRVVSKNTNNIFFKGHVCWTKYPKLMLKASNLWMPGPQDSIFQHPLEPEAGPEGGIRKYQLCFFRGPFYWTQYPKFMFRSFKTVETRASRLNFQTLPWVCRWPWGRYQKIPIMHFLRVCVFTKIPIVQLQNCGSQGPRNPFSNTFLSPRLALRVVTENTNNVFSKG